MQHLVTKKAVMGCKIKYPYEHPVTYSTPPYPFEFSTIFNNLIIVIDLSFDYCDFFPT